MDGAKDWRRTSPYDAQPKVNHDEPTNTSSQRSSISSSVRDKLEVSAILASANRPSIYILSDRTSLIMIKGLGLRDMTRIKIQTLAWTKPRSSTSTILVGSLARMSASQTCVRRADYGSSAVPGGSMQLPKFLFILYYID